MRNYDFHQLLSDEEFQKFATSIISVRENKKIRCNSMTNDGGVDFYDFENTLIGQVKNYKDNFTSLKNSLKQEIKKVNELKPERYILVTATPCSKKNKEELVTMFNGYLKYEDILDKHELNFLLEDVQYHDLEIKYLNLLVPNSFVLNHFLEKVEDRLIYTNTEIELNNIKNDRKIFFKTEIFDLALSKLLKEQTIIVSGQPGVGKSILGRMLSAYIINSNPNIQFFSISTIDELYQIYNKDSSQVYFFDDFFGDIKYNFQITTSLQTKLINFIDYIKKSKNKYLILTTREYILNDGLNINKKDSNKFNNYKFDLNLEDISRVSKFSILANHLNNTDLPREHIKIVLDYWQNIVDNKNYTPRLIETFLSNQNNYQNLSAIEFYKNFLNYIDTPYDYWKEILIKQPLEVIILLITLALSDEKIKVNVLNRRFNYLITGKNLEKNLDLTFSDYIKKLEDTFAITNIYDDELYIEFKNPSYRDFILDYFSKNISLYISYISDEVLTTKELINLWKVINKNYELYNDLKEVKNIDNIIQKRLLEEPEYVYIYYLLDLARVTDFNYETKIKMLIVVKVIELLESLEDLIYDDSEMFNLSFTFLKVLANKYDFSPYIYNTLVTLTFDSTNFYEIENILVIKELYPDIYKKFYKEYKKELKDTLYNSAVNDALFYQESKDEIGIELLTYEYAPNLYKSLNITFPIELREELSKILEDTYKLFKENYKDNNFDNNISSKDNITYPKEDLTLIEKKIEEIIGKSNYVYNLDKYLKNRNLTKETKRIINKIIKENSNFPLISSLICDEKVLNLLINYFDENKLEYNEINFLNSFIKFILNKNNLTENDYSNICNISFLAIKNNELTFTKEDLLNNEILHLNKFYIDKLLNSDFFVQKGKWYHLIHPLIQLYLPLNKLLDIEISIFKVLKLTDNYYDKLYNIDDYNYDEITTYHLLSLLFPISWKKVITEELSNFVNNIDKTNEITITKSILKQFNFTFYYRNNITSYNHINCFLYSLIEMYFYLDLIELFTLDDELSDEMLEYLEKFDSKENKLYINKKINNKNFINLLIENNIVKALTNLYNDVVNFIEDTERENILEKEVVTQ